MFKSGLILAAVMLLVGGGLAFLFPLCVPCLALLAGAGAGYLAGLWDRPQNNGAAIQRGAGAGALGGVGALFGHIAGALSAAAFTGPEGSLELARQLGLDLGAGAGQVDPGVFYASAGLTGCCFGLVEVALMAGLGALGGLLYWQMTGSKSAAPPPPAWPA